MQRDKRAHRTFGDVFGHISRADFTSWAAFKSSPILGWAAFIVTCVVITMLMTFSISNIPKVIIPGTIAQHDIRADRNYEILDEDATQRFKDEAIAGSLAVYGHDSDVAKSLAEKISAAFNDVRSKILEGDNIADLKPVLEQTLEISVPQEEWNMLVAQNFGKQVENAVNNALAGSLTKFISADYEFLQNQKGKGIVLKESNGGERTLTSREIGNILSLDDARKKIRKENNIATIIASYVLRPNTFYDAEETEIRQQKAADNVKPVVIKVEGGEIIIRAGSRYELRHAIILNGIKTEKEKSFTPLKYLGTFILVALVILSTYFFAERFIKKFAPNKADLFFMGIVLMLILIILRLSVTMARGLHEAMGQEIPLVAFYYAIPVGGAAMLVRFILNSETALVFSVVSCIFAGIFVGNNLDYTGYCLISSIAAAAAIAYADKRSAIIKAGIYTSVINIIAVLGIQLINANSLTEPFTIVNVLWYVIFAIIGGLSCAVLVTLITPIVESLFGYTTDIKLLELANLNHPLLRELVIRAPGTYHHSHLVGILAEAACESVGANPLLARVAAYYHDIGKIKKPLYFVENTTDCESRHEKLTPHMSALIISSHVKEGLELAQQYKVPQRISDIVAEHHGTKMIGFFYEKALKESDPTLPKPEEKDFRYAGPKPQTRESGILLLADSVEAAVRSLKEKSPARIQQMVEDVINASFIEAQLDECNLTLRNLHDIAKAFTKILMGIYHQRIEYPKEMLETNGSNGAIKNGN